MTSLPAVLAGLLACRAMPPAEGPGVDCSGAECNDPAAGDSVPATDSAGDSGVSGEVADADGDGYLSGDDCDDSDAATFPGAKETRGNGTDDDCDGRVDEHVTCWDGSGDFLTVQEGVDGTPDGGTLEICAGVYREQVVVDGRRMTVAGVDALTVTLTHPTDNDDAYPVEVRGDSEVHLESLRLEAPNYCVMANNIGEPVTVDRVDFSGCPRAVGGSGGPGVTITNSLFSGSTLWHEGDLDLRFNAFVGSDDSYLLQIEVEESGTIANNVFSGVELVIAAGTPVNAPPGTLLIEHNTFAALPRLTVYVGRTYAYLSVADVELRNNILAAVAKASDGTRPLYAVDWGGNDSSLVEMVPTASNNLISPDIDVSVDVNRVPTEANDSHEYEAELSAEIAAALLHTAIRDEAMFDTGAAGSYTLSGSSPAVDAGDGDPDPDGSAPDLGAFGGPNGDWYKEFTWPLP